MIFPSSLYILSRNEALPPENGKAVYACLILFYRLKLLNSNVRIVMGISSTYSLKAFTK